MNIRSRQPQGIPAGGQFATASHPEAGAVALAAPPSTLHRALDSAIADYEGRAQRLDDHDPLDDIRTVVTDPEADARYAAYRETVDRLSVLRDADLTEGELAAALDILGWELRARGDAALREGKRDVYAGIGTDILITAFENRDPVAQLQRRRTKIKALNGLQFEDVDLPSGVAMDRHIAKLKLSGIAGTVRGMKATGEYGKGLSAVIETPEGRSFQLDMAHSTLAVAWAEDPSVAVRVDLGRGEPVTPEILGESFREAVRHAAITDAWTNSTRMRSSSPGVHPAVSFTDYTVIEDGDITVAAVTAGNSISMYRVERLRNTATGESETRVQVLGSDESKASTRMTEAILADLSEAGGGEGSGAAFSRDLDKFAAAVTADPGYRAG
ncbi:hypothetical protein [Arthrobacter caoxuetaonis]|uniref:Uncharacterized protein n=1 Tax=Arthrobacter caoxuetaonis TaxID=2886935 RepID=A0A9X1MGS5_9MICC|nr:hypothetical protein [Arthrobacter caoxuetaonis]MCC3299783.1 hypothetical protein [Arthrobacter caoxuetaonis]USQ59316.1 hypothetical protein NF551_17180 [Arthrobacter caoxuetaonis]